ncbi:craniofacial development protein 2-like [Coccinella septempunctata]|uniref:craniofacial development protein 2-like n=1 Tax=Coccinella septempunctata TaxID=41139 RepID=UPI001D09933B|nr:craniofacial development protein 2-like [Coccinella septempunctata]
MIKCQLLKLQYPRRVERNAQNLVLILYQSAPRILGGGKKLAAGKASSKVWKLYLATYNVRSLLSEERLIELECELEQINWDVVGLSEVRRRGEQLCRLKSGHTFYHAGNEDSSIGGTGFLIHKRHNSGIVSIKTISPRVIYVILRLNKRYNMKFIQVYAPTTKQTDEEMDLFYDDVSKAWEDQRTHFTFLCGDFNAKVGLKSNNSETALGGFGSEGRNDRGEMLLGFLLQNNLFLMNSFFYKKLNRRWTWKSPDGRTKNEIDYIITDNKNTVKDVSVLNKFFTGSDHRIVRAKIVLNLKKERRNMITKSERNPWRPPTDIDGFQGNISNLLEDSEREENIEELNDAIVKALSASQEKYCPKTQKEEKISASTGLLMKERRFKGSQKTTTDEEIKAMNKQISKAIIKDIRRYKKEKIEETIENNKSMKVLRRKLRNGKGEMNKLRNKQGNITTNRNEILKTVEEFYQILYESRQEVDEEYEADFLTSKKGVVNQGSEEIPDITMGEIELALKKAKNNRSPGEDNIVADAIKIGGQRLLEKLKDLFNLCLFSCSIPKK